MNKAWATCTRTHGCCCRRRDNFEVLFKWIDFCFLNNQSLPNTTVALIDWIILELNNWLPPPIPGARKAMELKIKHNWLADFYFEQTIDNRTIRYIAPISQVVHFFHCFSSQRRVFTLWLHDCLWFVDSLTKKSHWFASQSAGSLLYQKKPRK